MPSQILSPIIGVAIKYDGKIYSLPSPNRHHDVIRMIAQENGVGIQGPDIQGFVDEEGYFLDRRQALVVAMHFDQVINPKSIRGERLYSEDLW
ncbi:hypothetical protein UFOVP273_78 [uncultured Caudovirales phage]|uniref:Uncharacterized protein n=1 Tax=uncultured Caudovirales phage TaxID=2100421 RepID=A0A6J5LRW0_9CAUD|nr:hypothetical protein UFOVP273_78 [uncultured Caudovirales phage]